MHLSDILSGSLRSGLELATFWLSLSLLFYIYAGYPLLLRLIGLFFRPAAPAPTTAPTLTVIICAHNEARSIREKLNDTLGLEYPAKKLQIIVASDGSTDSTDDIVRSFSDRNVELVRLDRQAGKTCAQNTAARQARGEILIFSDATTQYHPQALKYLAGNFTDASVGASSGRYIYLDSSGEVPAGGPQAYATYDNTVRNLQSQVGSITGCCGCIYAVRRSLYTPLADHIISDLVQPLCVLKQGYRVTLEPRAIAWEVSTLTTKREFAMRVRVVARALTGLFSVPELLSPWRFPWLASQIWSHKLLRWSVPAILLALLGSSAALSANPFYAVAFYLQLALYLAAATTLVLPLQRYWPVLGIPLYFCTINAAAVMGLLQYLRGNRYTAWRPERDDAHAV